MAPKVLRGIAFILKVIIFEDFHRKFHTNVPNSDTRSNNKHVMPIDNCTVTLPSEETPLCFL